MNNVQLFGHVGADPELRYTGNDTAVANIRLATSKSWTDQNGEKRDKTEWHTLVFFGKKAEVVAEYVSKGDPLLIESSELVYNQWEDDEGRKRTDAQVKVYRFSLMSKRVGESTGQGDTNQSQSPSSQQEPTGNDNSFTPDDDLPF